MKTANASAIPSTNDPVRGHPSGHTVTRRTGSVTSPSHSPGSVEAHRFDKSARRQARNSARIPEQIAGRVCGRADLPLRGRFQLSVTSA